MLVLNKEMAIGTKAAVQDSCAWRKERWVKRSPDKSGKRKGVSFGSFKSPSRDWSVSKTVSTESSSTSPTSTKNQMCKTTPLRSNNSLTKLDMSSTESFDTGNTEPTATKRVTFKDNFTQQSILEESMEISLEEDVTPQRIPSYARHQNKNQPDTELPSVSSMGTDSYDRSVEFGPDGINFGEDSYEQVIRDFRREEAERQIGRKFFVETVAGKLYVNRLEPKPKKKKPKKRKKKKKRRPRYVPQPSIEEEMSFEESYSREEGYSVEECSQDDYVKQQVFTKTKQKRYVQQDDGFYMETRTFLSVSTTSKSNTYDDSTLSTDGAFPDLTPVQEIPDPIFAPKTSPEERWQKTTKARAEAEKQANDQMPIFSEKEWYVYHAERDDSLTLKNKRRMWFPRFLRRRPKRLLKKIPNIRRFIPRLRRRRNKRIKKYQGLFENTSPDSYNDMASLLSQDPQVVVTPDRLLALTSEFESAKSHIKQTTPMEEASTSSSERNSVKQKRKFSYIFPKTTADPANFSSSEDVDRPSVTLKQHLKRIGVTMNSLSTVLEGSDRSGSSSRLSIGKTSSKALSQVDSSTKSIQQ